MNFDAARHVETAHWGYDLKKINRTISNKGYEIQWPQAVVWSLSLAEIYSEGKTSEKKL